jgi:hypothetical protein
MDLNTGLTTAFAKTAAGGGMDFNSEAQANTRIGAVFRKLNVGTKRFLIAFRIFLIIIFSFSSLVF